MNGSNLKSRKHFASARFEFVSHLRIVNLIISQKEKKNYINILSI